MRIYFVFLFLIVQFFPQSSVAAAEFVDDHVASGREIRSVIEEYRHNVQQTMANFAATSKMGAAWYENARLHIGCSCAAGISALLLAHEFIFEPLAKEAGSLCIQSWRWLLDCDLNDPLRESQCSYASYASFATWIPAAFYFGFKYRPPAENWVRNKAHDLARDLIDREVRRRSAQRFLALELEDAKRISIQVRSSQELQGRAEEIHQLDDETRKSVFKIASWVGNERSVDALVVRGCDARHCFHKSCLNNWYESSGDASCPMCLDKAKPNTQELLDCLNRGIQSEIKVFSRTPVHIDS